jgi:hypothetical protein
MVKKVHYYGASTIIKANPEGGGKVRRTKLGGLQIAAANWASNPPPTFPLYPPNADELRLRTPTRKRKKNRVPKGARVLE